jgi:hypothetical protein
VMFVRSEAPKSAEWQRHLSFSATKPAGEQRRRDCKRYCHPGPKVKDRTSRY